MRRLDLNCVFRASGHWSRALFAFAFLASSVANAGDSGKPIKTSLRDRITDLIQQLGDDKYANRVSAERKLIAVGVVAKSHLQRAASTTPDLEIRFRCQRILRSIASTVAKRELQRWQGTWRNGDQTFVIKGEYWWWGPTATLKASQLNKNRIRIIEVLPKFTLTDLSVKIGHFSGRTCKAIFQLRGDTLYYSGSYKSRPSAFENGGGYTVAWKRIKKSTDK